MNNTFCFSAARASGARHFQTMQPAPLKNREENCSTGLFSINIQLLTELLFSLIKRRSEHTAIPAVSRSAPRLELARSEPRITLTITTFENRGAGPFIS